jgi:acetyltransferase-like isoleucine patch superfamily enzyme
MKRFLTGRLSEKQKKTLRDWLYAPNLPFDFLFCLIKRLSWKSNWRLWGFPVIENRGVIEIGSNFVAVSSQKHNSIGIVQPVVLKTLRRDAVISIGNDVGISGCTISAAGSISIGNEVLIGSGSIITDNDAHAINPEGRRHNTAPEEPKPVIIENNVFVGARVIILKGVTIGTGSVIGAGSVVVSDIPAYTIASGNPAEFRGDCRKS